MKRSILAYAAIAFTLSWGSLWAQERSVTGKVTSQEDGSPLPGVNVVLKGTSQGTSTDVEGRFTIPVPPQGGVLVFSFIGLKSTEVTITTQSSVDVQMGQDATQLQEVVVNALGLETPRDKLGTAPAVVRGDAMLSSGEANVINSLSGKAPGINIVRNGSDPGAGSYIQIRGQSTVTGTLQPLVVIDGMPMYNSYQDNGNQVDGVQQQSRLNDLNPEDIASVEILKSASAAALWGSRALNGVIMITTKKGKSGKLNIGYTGTLSFDQVNKVPDLQTTYGQGAGGRFAWGNARSWGDRIANRPGGADDYITDPENENYAGYIELADGTRIYRVASGTNDDRSGGKNSRDVYDHAKEVFQTGRYLENGVNLSGGNDRSNFYVSYSNLDQKGIIKNNSNYKRNTARVNFTTMLTDRVSASANISYSNIRSNRIQQGSNLGGIFLGGLRSPADFNNENYVGTYYNPDGIATPNQQITFRNPIGAAGPGFDNPLWTIENNKSFNIVNRIIGNVELNYDITNWLSLKGNAGVDTYADKRTDFVNAQSAILPGGSYTDQTITESQWNTNLFAIAKNTFSNAFSGSATIGFNYNSRQFYNVGATGVGFIIPDAPPNLLNSDPRNRTPINAANTVRTSAGFAELIGEFYEQVFVTLTGRAETASTFGADAQSLFFYPSASVAWQFTKAMGTSNFLNFGKLRASYGVVGLEPPVYTNLTTYLPTSVVETWGGTLSGPAYGVGGYSISTTFGNPAIKPERKHEVEAGFDLRFFQDRANLTATAFYNKTTDAILPVAVASSSGPSFINQNAAELEAKGLEFSLEPIWIRSKSGFTWSSSFIWSNYRSKVLTLRGAESVFLSGGGFTDGSSRAVEGQPMGVLWGTYYARDANGNYILNENGFPTLAANEGVIGNPNPDFKMSIGNTFSFKGISLYALFDFQKGGDVWNGTWGALMNYGTASESAIETVLSASQAQTIKTFDGQTVAAGGRAVQNPDGSYILRGTIQDFGAGPVALDERWYTNTGGGFNVNGPFVEDGSWARLRELTLSYTLNSSAFKSSTKLSSITIAATGRNLVLWTDYKGIDPETNLTGANNGRGIDYFQNPNTRSIVFKLSINY